jgi:hypothetical protein
MNLNLLNLNLNWYKIAQINEKEPWQMTQNEFLQYHITGFIESHVYDQYKTIEGIRHFNDKKDYPLLYDTKEFNGITVEFRKSGNPLKYVKTDENDNIVRDEKGLVTYLSKEEMINENLPLEDQSIVAFIGDDPIGFACNEFGATGVWVVEDYQKLGIGSYLLKEFRKTMKPSAPLGQATEAGIALTKKYHKNIVKEALTEGKPVPDKVLEDYPDLIGKQYDINYWIKQITKNPIKYHKIPKEFQHNPQIQNIMKNIYINMMKKEPISYHSIPKEFKESPEIQKIINSNPEKYAL